MFSAGGGGGGGGGDEILQPNIIFTSLLNRNQKSWTVDGDAAADEAKVKFVKGQILGKEVVTDASVKEVFEKEFMKDFSARVSTLLAKESELHGRFLASVRSLPHKPTEVALTWPNIQSEEIFEFKDFPKFAMKAKANKLLTPVNYELWKLLWNKGIEKVVIDAGISLPTAPFRVQVKDKWITVEYDSFISVLGYDAAPVDQKIHLGIFKKPFVEDKKGIHIFAGGPAAGGGGGILMMGARVMTP